MQENKAEKPVNPAINRSVVRFELSGSTIISIVMVVATLWLLSRLVPVILVLVMAFLLVGALGPLVKWLESQKIPRKVGIAIVFISLISGIILFITLTIPEMLIQLQGALEQEPVIRAKVVDYLKQNKFTAPLAESIRRFKYDTLVLSSAMSAWNFSTRIFEFLGYSFLTVFLALYIMIDRDRLRGALFLLIPRQYHIRLSRVLVNLETIVGGYIRGQFLTSFLLAAFIFILLSAVGVEAALALALFGGAADVLPYIGIFVTMIPVVLSALSKGTVIFLIVFALMFAYEEFAGRILIPIIYGRALRLPSSVVLFALLTGATLMGMAGALLALPIAAAIRMLIVELRVDLPGQEEQKEDVQVKARDKIAELEYEQRTGGMTADQAAAIAVEISGDRKKEEDSLPPTEQQLDNEGNK